MDIRTVKDIAARHRVKIIEGGPEVPGVEPMPGYFAMKCSCGWDYRTYWGKPHADETARRHVFMMVTNVALTPGGANAAPR